MALDRIEDDIIPDQYGPYQRGSNEDSFQEQPQANSAPMPKNAPLPPSNKKVVVPMLVLPTANNRDSNPTIISRSTRRHEMLNKSSVSTSNRLANPWGAEGMIHLSREPSLRDRRISIGASNDVNMSYLDDQADAYFVMQQTNLPVVSVGHASEAETRPKTR
jgi:transglutaminase/protease-like cytokinesis protein 3